MAGWERRVKKLCRYIVVVSLMQVAVISVCQQAAMYGPRLRPSSVMVAATTTTRIIEDSDKKGYIHQNHNVRAAPSLTVGYTGNACTNRSKSGRKCAALTLTAVHGVQHSKGTSAPIALNQAALNLGGGGWHRKASPKMPTPIAPKQAAFNLGAG